MKSTTVWKVGAYALAIAAIALVTACGEDGANRRDGEAKDFIAVQRTVSGESLATCLARSGFVFVDTYVGVANTIQATYDKDKKEAITINVDRKAGIVAPWDARDDKVLKAYHCQVSDVQDNQHGHASPSATAMATA